MQNEESRMKNKEWRKVVAIWSIGVTLYALLSVLALGSFAVPALAGTQNESLAMPPNNLGLVAHWTFDGPTISGTSVADVSGGGNMGTTVNSPTPVTGVIGQALSFNGTNQYVSVPYSSSITWPMGQPRTFTFWYKRNDNTVDGLISSGTSPSAGVNYIIAFATSNFGAVVNGMQIGYYSPTYGWEVFSTPVAYTDTKSWHFVVVEYTFGVGSSARIYVDGQNANATWISGNGNVTITPEVSPMAIGVNLPYLGGFLNGVLDDVRIYNRALSASEVQQLYNLGTVTHQNATITPQSLASGLVAHWTFDGPTTLGTTVEDVSGNNNSTIVGSPTPVTGIMGQAFYFPLTSSSGGNYIAVSSPLSDLNISYPLTVSIWYKTKNNNSANGNTNSAQGGWNVMMRRETSSGTRYLWSLNFGGSNVCGGQNLSGKAAFEVYNSGSDYCVPGVNITDDDKWHNAVGVISSTQAMSFYVDGALQGNVQANSLGVPNGQLWIAQDPPWLSNSSSGAQYIGSLDDPHIYNRTLSASEVQQLYNLGTATHQNATITPQSLASGLVGHWTFDGPDMLQNVKDTSGQGNNGALVTGGVATSTMVTPGVLGQALKFNGSSQYVNTNTHIGNIAPANGSICLWAYNKHPYNSGLNEAIFDQAASGGAYNEFTLLHFNDNNIYAGFSNFPSEYRVVLAASATNWPVDKWTQYCLTWVNGGATKLYINGSYAGTNGVATVVQNGAYTLDFGHYYWANTDYYGSLDDVHIYNRTLSASEVQQLYNLGR